MMEAIEQLQVFQKIVEKNGEESYTFPVCLLDEAGE